MDQRLVSRSQAMELDPEHPLEPILGGELSLPTEIWMLIFEKLNVRHLRNVRLTCLTWNRIVGNSPVLMDRFPVVIFRGDALCETFPVSWARYRKAKLGRLTDIGQSSTFRQFHNQWALFGSSLTTLTIEYYCEIDFTQLLAILKVTANLKHLNYKQAEGRHNYHCTVDFKLNKLEELKLCNIHSYKLLDVFSNICPHLKLIEIHFPDAVIRKGNSKYDRSITNFVNKVHKTLTEIEIQLPTWAHGTISAMKRLQLNRVTISEYYRSTEMRPEIYEFIIAFPAITYLDISSITITRPSMLPEIGTKLPNLRFFKANVPDETLEFLGTMPRLERLSISSCCKESPSFDLGGFALQVLQHLEYNGSDIPLLNQQHFPRLCSINVESIASKYRVTDALKTITLLKSLQRLYFDSIRFLDETILPSVSVSNIRVLKISSSTKMNIAEWINGDYYYAVPDNVLVALLRHCPALEELLLSARFNGSCVLPEVCLLTRLRVLAIVNRDLTESCLRYLVAHRNQMKNLRQFKLGPSDHFSIGVAQVILSDLDGVEMWYNYDELEEDHAESEWK